MSSLSLASSSEYSADISEIPWAAVEGSMIAWIDHLRAASASGNPQKVLVLLEALVRFITSNDGGFLYKIVSGRAGMERDLRDRGAPESVIQTFKEVFQCTGGMEGAILSFGSTSMPPDLAADMIASMKKAEGSMAPMSPAARSTSPRRHNYLPHRTTQDMLDQVSSGAHTNAEHPNSVQVGNWANAVAVPVDDLSPAVISGLEAADAVPFLILRWLNACLVEAIFCIHHADTTIVLKRRVVYVGPKPGTQIEGQLALDTHEELLRLEAPASLPWIDVAGLLTAPGDLAH